MALPFEYLGGGLQKMSQEHTRQGKHSDTGQGL